MKGRFASFVLMVLSPPFLRTDVVSKVSLGVASWTVGS